ncbi:hypothetical protein ABT116_39090, partial [Streptomyces sp. NPDC002130]|uniref:hypothetical protein n=1 Tax=Streptomyces sp. NPDC002130 TaxID=3155568 RepID=UPI00332D75EC
SADTVETVDGLRELLAFGGLAERRRRLAEQGRRIGSSPTSARRGGITHARARRSPSAPRHWDRRERPCTTCSERSSPLLGAIAPTPEATAYART